jgi:hypothetical protein
MRRTLALLVALAAPVASADSSMPPKRQAQAAGTLDDLLPRIARRLERMAGSNPKLAGFRADRAVVYFNPVHAAALSWSHGTREVPNPDYARERRAFAEAQSRHLLASAPRPTVTAFDPRDGIALRIEIFPDGGRMMQRVIVPYATVGDAAIEVSLESAPIQRVDVQQYDIKTAIAEEIAHTAGVKLAPLP